MCDRVDISYVGLREREAGTVCCAKHMLARLGIMPVAVGAKQVAVDFPHRLDRVRARVARGGAADVRLHGMHECIHAGRRGYVRRQAERGAVVEHRVAWDEREIVDGVLVVGLVVRDNGREGRFRTGSGGRGHGDEKRQRAQNLQDAAHLLHGLAWPHDARTGSLRAIHSGTSTERDDGIASFLQIALSRSLDIAHRGVGHDLIEHTHLDTPALQIVDELVGETKAHDRGIGYEKHLALALLLQEPCGLFEGAERLGFAVG